MTTKLLWRLSKLPTPSELTELVQNKIITQEEAKEILLSPVDERDSDSLKEEIKFLRELVEKLSTSQTKIIETIRTVEVPYRQYSWYQPYYYWGDTHLNTTGLAQSTYTATGSTNLGNAVAVTNASNLVGGTSAVDFSKIKTF